MTKLYFLRHGEAGDRTAYMGENDHLRPLTEEGIAAMKREARFVGDMKLKLDAIVTSPLVRACETAKIVAKVFGLKAQENDLLKPGFNVAALRGRGHQARGAGIGVGAGFREQVHHRLPDPPQRRGLEVRVVRGIEPPCCLDQSEIAFVDQVQERHAEPPESPGVVHDHAKVGLHEKTECVFVAVLLNSCAKLTLVIRCQRGEA